MKFVGVVKKLLPFVGLSALIGVYILLAYKNPFKLNNLIANLEPFPDTFYYSVPVWNWLHGKGYKMAYEGMKIPQDVPPLYGFLLLPLFKVFNDVRSYYLTNLFLGIGSLLLFFRLAWKFFEKSKIRIWLVLLTGFILATNFYFYNLPTLMMAENPQILLILAAANVLIAEFSLGSVLLTALIAGVMLVTKMSNLPVIACMIMWTFIKILKTKFWKKYDRKLIGVVLGLLLILCGYFFYNFIYLKLGLFTKGDWWFSTRYFGKFFPYYLGEFVGKNGHYLWYFNQQIEAVIGWLALAGTVIGLGTKAYREKAMILGSMILAVIAFHSFLYFPEGRYVSVVIPLWIIMAGLVPDLLSRFKLGFVSVVVIGLIYLGSRQVVNGFEERKVTSLKRQLMNNTLAENEVPWNYKAIENYNKYFSKKEEVVYLGSLLPPFNFMYFSNGNYKYLPITGMQELGEARGLSSQIYKESGSLLDHYQKLLKEGNKVYVSDYFMANNPGVWDKEFEKIRERFNLVEVSDGCLGICKIYQVELKNEKK